MTQQLLTIDATQEQLAVARARAELAQAKAEARLWESVSSVGMGWGPGWGDLVDPFYHRRDDFGQLWLPLGAGTLHGRQHGRNRPFQWTDFDLDRSRSLARWLATKNDLVIGAMKTIRNYTVKQGYKWEARPAQGYEEDKEVVNLAREVQAVIDEYADLNNLKARERSACWRSVRDGEVFTRHFPQEDGRTLVRFVEPEQVREQPGADADCAFGIETEDGDVESVVAYHVTYDGTRYDRVPATDVCHLKRNVDECVKRGLSDLYSSGEAFDGVHKLLRNMREAGAVQAAVAWIEQFAGTSASQLGAHIGAIKDLNRPQVQHPISGRDLNYQRFEPGSIIKVQEGREYIPAPMAANTTQHTGIVQACLRALGCRWNMPEYMISGDASNANYSSTLVSGSPFVNAVECEQDDFGLFYLRWRWIAIRNACAARRITTPFEQVMHLIDLHYTAPQVAVANQGEQAEIDHKDIAAGVLSLQTRRARRNLVDEQERKNLKEEPLTRVQGRATDLDPQGNPIKPDQQGQGQGGQQGQPDPQALAGEVKSYLAELAQQAGVAAPQLDDQAILQAMQQALGSVSESIIRETFDPGKVHRGQPGNAGQFGSGGGASKGGSRNQGASGGAAGQGSSPGLGQAEKAAQGILAKLGGKARALPGKVRDWAVNKYQDLESKYGRAGAVVILGATAAIIATPLPGTLLAAPLPELAAKAIVAVAGKLKAPRGVQESKDDAGHEHGNDGKFTGSGGGASGEKAGSSEPARQEWQAREENRDAARTQVQASRDALNDTTAHLAADNAWTAAHNAITFDQQTPVPVTEAVARASESARAAVLAARDLIGRAARTLQGTEHDEGYIAEYEEIRAKRDATLAKAETGYHKALADYQDATEAFTAHAEAEPEAPSDPVEPDYPDEPDEPEEDAEAHAQWAKDHAAWEKETGQLEKEWDKAQDDHDKAVDRWQATRDRWEAKYDRLNDAVDTKADRLEERYGKLDEARDEFVNDCEAALQEAADAADQWIDYQSEQDAEPEEESGDEDDDSRAV
jgi:lambda family portal protein